MYTEVEIQSRTYWAKQKHNDLDCFDGTKIWVGVLCVPGRGEGLAGILSDGGYGDIGLIRD